MGETRDNEVVLRRASDLKGIQRYTCFIARRLTEFWDFIDKRDIDKHAVSLGIFWGTIQVTQWAMSYAELVTDKNGVEAAAVIAAVLAPYCALQAAAVSFYFRARS